MADTSKQVTAKILHVTKTVEQWAEVTTIISKGLLCVELDGNDTHIKIGDGTKTYDKLPYVGDGSFNIANYYTSEETDKAIEDAFSEIGNIITIKGVKPTMGDLPMEGNRVGDLWFVGSAGETTDSFSEYIWSTAQQWEFLGRVQTDVDLSGYAKISYVDEQDKALSDRIDPLETNNHTHENKDILDETTAAFTEELAEKLAGIEEGATAITVDSELSETSTNPVENKVVAAAIKDAVDNVHTHDNKEVLDQLTQDDLDKLDGIEEGATKVIVDETPTKDSTNAVSSGAVADAIESIESEIETLTTDSHTHDNKETLDKITEDIITNSHTHDNQDILDATTAAFTEEMAEKLEGITVDSEMSTTSENPLQNKVVTEAYNGLDERVGAIEEDYIKSTDTLILNCIL